LKENRRKEKKGKMVDVRHCIIASFSIPSLSPIHSMPKDTKDNRKSICNEIVLMILRLADEGMLNESGNAVYLRMKRELDEFR
jgi:hypothetical protein